MSQIDCRWFSGYKPCGKATECVSTCTSKEVPSHRILVVHLEALGAVLRATSILPAIRRKYPKAHITWVTKAPADLLLEGNQLIDKLYTLTFENLLSLENIQFDIAYCIDKSLVATGLIQRLKPHVVKGFVASRSGAIIPANSEANELWQLGLNDALKFFKNQKAETQLMIEALDLGDFKRDEYVLGLSAQEKQIAERRRLEWAPAHEYIIGLNTGCANTIPAKKMSIKAHRELISALLTWPAVKIVLLGGREDVERNKEIAHSLDVLISPMENGLRDGLASIEACDIVVTGDSLGMHMAIGLKKWVVAWFGPTCAQEIDLYERGEKIMAQVPCAPCWKRSCQKSLMCYDQVPLDQLLAAIQKGMKWKSSSSKQPFSEISSLVSR